jgi:hypothetical protein
MHRSLTGVQVVVTHTLIGTLLLGLLIVTVEKGKAKEISYADACSLVTFFWGFIIIVTTGNVF